VTTGICLSTRTTSRTVSMSSLFEHALLQIIWEMRTENMTAAEVKDIENMTDRQTAAELRH